MLCILFADQIAGAIAVKHFPEELRCCLLRWKAQRSQFNALPCHPLTLRSGLSRIPLSRSL